jgi:hypothetical protein
VRIKVEFAGLDALRREMGAPLVRWEAGLRPGNFNDLGVPVIEREVENLSELEIGPGDTIICDNLRVFLYIREFRVEAESFDEAAGQPENLRRFHVVWCRTLRRMQAAGRFERYVVSNRVEEPFTLALELRHGSASCGDAELLVCQDCLGHINWRGFRSADKRSKKRFVTHFSRREFLRTQHTHFADMPSRTDASLPDLGYAADWIKRSREYREIRNWRCEGCLVDLSTRKGLLDAHHINGVRSDNRFSNLRALCKLCHAKSHPGHYRVSEEDRRALDALRKSQGLG